MARKRSGGNRTDLTIRTVNKRTGRTAGGFDIRNVSPERAAMVARAAQKAARQVAPGHEIRASTTPPKKGSGRATVKVHSRKSVSPFGNSPDAWERIFGDKRNRN